MMKDSETPGLQPTTRVEKPHRAEATSANKAWAFAQFREKSELTSPRRRRLNAFRPTRDFRSWTGALRVVVWFFKQRIKSDFVCLLLVGWLILLVCFLVGG